MRNLVNNLARRINAPIHLLPTFGSPIGDTTPNIEIDNSGLYNYIISGRGNEHIRQATSDLDELMYCFFQI